MDTSNQHSQIIWVAGQPFYGLLQLSFPLFTIHSSGFLYSRGVMGFLKLTLKHLLALEDWKSLLGKVLIYISQCGYKSVRIEPRGTGAY